MKATEKSPSTHSSGHFKEAEMTEMVREEETIDNYLLPDLCHQQALLKLVLETRHQQYLLGRNTRTGYHTKEIVLLTQVSHRNLEACTKKKKNRAKILFTWDSVCQLLTFISSLIFLMLTRKGCLYWAGKALFSEREWLWRSRLASFPLPLSGQILRLL